MITAEVGLVVWAFTLTSLWLSQRNNPLLGAKDRMQALNDMESAIKKHLKENCQNSWENGCPMILSTPRAPGCSQLPNDKVFPPREVTGNLNGNEGNKNPYGVIKLPAADGAAGTAGTGTSGTV